MFWAQWRGSGEVDCSAGRVERRLIEVVSLLSQPIRVPVASLSERFRGAAGRRAAGLGLALLLEALLALLLLTLAPSVEPHREDERATVFSFASEQAVEPEPVKAEPARVATDPRPTQAEAQPQPAAPAVVAAPPAIIQLSREQMAAADVSPPAAPPAAPAAPSRRVYGPPDTGVRSAWADTPRVDGMGPNGEPLYAASWYREPYPEELRGYLSAARGPGWGLIACRTAPNYRVEDCVAVGESPAGSNIARSVLAAAWQFKVRPPRVGGELRVGEWVRIRIDYSTSAR